MKDFYFSFFFFFDSISIIIIQTNRFTKSFLAIWKSDEFRICKRISILKSHSIR
jgi:hypothetical protein